MSALGTDGCAYVALLNYYGNEICRAHYRRVPVAGDFVILPDGRKSGVIDVDLCPVLERNGGDVEALVTLHIDKPTGVA